MNETSAPFEPTPSSMRTLRRVLQFTVIYLAVATPWAISRGNKEFLFYIVVMIAVISLIALVHCRVGLSASALWAISVFGLFHLAGGLLPVPDSWPINGENRVLYSLWLIPGRLRYDHLLHAGGHALLTWVFWQTLRKAIIGNCRTRPTFGLLAFCVAASMGFGAFNEVVEFIATIYYPPTNVGGYENTGWDLVANGVGAVIAAALIRLTWSLAQIPTVVTPPSIQ